MTQEQFALTYETVYLTIQQLAEAARREGLLSLEAFLDKKRILERDPLHVGLQLVIDGTDGEIVRTVYDNLMEADCPSYGYERIILKVIKTGVLSIQAGDNPRIIGVLMDSVCPRDMRPKILTTPKEE